jgi:hypothetical protein
MRKAIFLAPLLLALTALSVCATELISTNSDWRFRKGTSEASAPTEAWRLTAFDDASAGFGNAPAPFWYGDVRPGGTQLNDMQNGYSSIFLRRTFMIGNPAQVTSLRLRAFIDDGFVAWINGVEVARTNVPASLAYNALAPNFVAEPVQLITYNLPLPSGYLIVGTNVLTIQGFNNTLSNPDFGFDTLLDVTITEIPPVAPTISNITPPAGLVSSLTTITVTFSEPVTGVQADDFFINGIPAASMNVSGNTYTFNFGQPFYGTVFITWDVASGIADLATPPNVFNATAPRRDLAIQSRGQHSPHPRKSLSARRFHARFAQPD